MNLVDLVSVILFSDLPFLKKKDSRDNQDPSCKLRTGVQVRIEVAAASP